MFKKWIVGLLSAAILLTGVTMTACRNDEPSAQVSESSPVNSARAIDMGDAVYYLDSSGELWVSVNGDADRVASLSATQIAAVGGDIWYAAGDKLYSYALSDGESTLICSLPAAIDCFSVCGKTLYCLADGALYSSNGSLIADFKTLTATDGTSLATVQRISMENAEEIILYLPNPSYINEAGAEDPPAHNDVNLTYCYSLTTELICLIDQFAGEDSPSNSASSDDSYVINGHALPFSDYPVGSYFTQNGKACTCHNRSGCISNNLSGENCIRYWPNKTNTEVDLKGVQCMGFARFCQWRLYGSHDYANTTDFYNAFGSQLAAGSWTANTVKETFTDVGPGGHIRTGAGHSLFVISVSASGFVTYECNTSARDCKIYTRQWTWDSFFAYAGSRPLLYYNMPKQIDNSTQVTPPTEEYKTGTYQVVANGGLNLRAEPTTASSLLDTIPQGSLINVTLVQQVGSYYWGYTEFERQLGWVRLDYTLYQNATIESIQITVLPDKTSYTVGDSFSTAGMTVEAKFTNGAAFEIAGYTCSGYDMSKAGTYTVTVRYGEYTDSFSIEVKEKVIPPTSIKLSETSLTLIVGDTYQLSYTILPADTTQKGVTWSASSSAVASVDSGIIDAHTPGSSTITVTTENGLKATCRVTVINMPTGVNWSTTADGQPLSALPVGIEAVDYSIRYRLPEGNDWGEWIYDTPPESADSYQCQFRAFTATFVNTLDGSTVDQFTVEFNEVVTVSKYTLSQDGYLFTGWYTDPHAAQIHDVSKACDKRVTATGDLIFYAGWIEIGSISADIDDPLADGHQVPAFGIAGVELRVSDDAPGLRFLTRLSTDLISALEEINRSNRGLQPSGSSDTGVGYGTVICLKSKVSRSLVKGDGSYLYKGSAVTVPAYRTYAEHDHYLLYNAFVCGFSEKYYKTDFVARPYITYYDANGTFHTYYFTYTGANAAGGGYYTNLYDEAVKLAADPATDEATLRWLNDHILGN